MNWIEWIGIAATLFILASMCFKTVSFKGSILMRSLNIFGSIVFVVYGAILPAISTAVLNGALVIVNSVHLVLLIKEQKKLQKDGEDKVVEPESQNEETNVKTADEENQNDTEKAEEK